MAQTLSYEQIVCALLEGPPLVMLDALEIDPTAGTANGTKAVSIGEPFFQGHFPGTPIMPGVLQVAAMVQAASLLASEGGPVKVRLVSLERTKFRKPVSPGDVVQIEVKATGAEDSGALGFEGKTLLDGATACSARFSLADHAVCEPPACVMPEGDVREHVDTLGVMKIIPHRFPFLLLDGTNRYDGVAVGYKNISGGDALLVGAKHGSFFEYLQVEAAAQAACVEALSLPEAQGKLGFFMSIDKAEFFRQVGPGDRLEILVDFILRGRFGSGEATGQVAGKTVCHATMKFVLVPRPPIEV